MIEAETFPPYLDGGDGERAYVRHDLADAPPAALAYVRELGLVDVDVLEDVTPSLVAMGPHDCTREGCNSGLEGAGECGRRREGWHDERSIRALQSGDLDPTAWRLYWRLDFA